VARFPTPAVLAAQPVGASVQLAASVPTEQKVHLVQAQQVPRAQRVRPVLRVPLV